ncbi:transposase [Haemophilus influenzae PittHH]|uniref:Transposase n=1 Tax=Haemophilus influenzae TaxID=727 RepID=A0A158SXU4_HAEIF|nr:transposase [Haemophilus influenzae PittHH]KIS35688.1 Transposase [Haemophilus influenzae]PRL67219.1 Transposase zinc-ribbon domain protein [Haemophilus influenzae]
MAQHYLLSSKSKNINLKDILRLTEEDAFHLLKIYRWGNTGNIRDVCCPHCGIRHEAYFLASRKRWCCKHCERHFYITTNTVFAFHKVKLVDILVVIVMMVSCSKGINSIDVSRLLHLNYKTAFVLCGKVREALFKRAI